MSNTPPERYLKPPTLATSSLRMQWQSDPKPVELPPYQRRHQSVAAQSPNVRNRYREKINAIRAELERAEEAMARGFERLDAANNTKRRIDDLAATKRRYDQSK